MGNASEFRRAAQLVVDHVLFDRCTTVQVFEATIRCVCVCVCVCARRRGGVRGGVAEGRYRVCSRERFLNCMYNLLHSKWLRRKPLYHIYSHCLVLYNSLACTVCIYHCVSVLLMDAPLRVMGSLLSAYLLTQSPPHSSLLPTLLSPDDPISERLLELAHDLATRLLPAFDNTSTGLPHPRVWSRYYNCVGTVDVFSIMQAATHSFLFMYVHVCTLPYSTISPSLLLSFALPILLTLFLYHSPPTISTLLTFFYLSLLLYPPPILYHFPIFSSYLLSPLSPL